MLAFITAITLVAIVIGGSFGWFSAVAVGAIDAAIPDNTHPDTDDKGRHPAPSSIASIPQRVELVLRDVQNDFSDSKNAKTTSVQQQQPDIWTRRRGTALSSLRP
ncbi:hypothetical protein GGI15_002864 [Coemansia interrupta]|uniref:Uncharacterized protein n=1 Tax=Coemansia interrupta TaxID=1126814 RepID=A0A9W8HCN6_9FUNG|nr:hypothetical protein GGI15_002864 [Coemansia interrupta]